MGMHYLWMICATNWMLESKKKKSMEVLGRFPSSKLQISLPFPPPPTTIVTPHHTLLSPAPQPGQTGFTKVPLRNKGFIFFEVNLNLPDHSLNRYETRESFESHESAPDGERSCASVSLLMDLSAGETFWVSLPLQHTECRFRTRSEKL